MGGRGDYYPLFHGGVPGDEPRSVLQRMFLIFDVDNSGQITKVGRTVKS